MKRSEHDRRRDRCLGRLLGKLRRSCRHWSLLPEGGGRLAVGVSGGVDSLALLVLLSAYNRSARSPFDLCGLHVDLDADGRSGPLPEPVAAWCRELGVSMEEVVPRIDPGERFPIGCHRCARVRRRALIEGADARGCSLLALGHHADDVVETWLMSLFYTGTAEAMVPKRSYFGGVVTVIRPMIELRRSELRRLGRLSGAPEPVAACSREDDGKRARVCAALASLGADQRRVRRQLFWAAARRWKADPTVDAGKRVSPDDHL